MKKGFTLIELVIVMGMIMIFAALLFPALAKDRERSRQLACASNLRELAVATAQYAQDNDYRQPPAPGWGRRVFPWVKTRKSYRCPSEHVSEEPLAGDNIWTSYGENPKLSAVRLEKVSDPSCVVELYEIKGEWLMQGSLMKGGVAPPAPGRHTGGGEWAFLDGHVRHYGPESLDASNFDYHVPAR